MAARLTCVYLSMASCNRSSRTAMLPSFFSVSALSFCSGVASGARGAGAGAAAMLVAALV